MAAASSLQKILTAPLVSSSILLSSSFLQVRQEALASLQVLQHDKCITGSRLHLTACCWPSGPPAVHDTLQGSNSITNCALSTTTSTAATTLHAGDTQNELCPVLHDAFNQRVHWLAGCPSAKLVPVSAIGEHGSIPSDAHQGRTALATAAMLARPQLADTATLLCS